VSMGPIRRNVFRAIRYFRAMMNPKTPLRLNLCKTRAHAFYTIGRIKPAPHHFVESVKPEKIAGRGSELARSAGLAFISGQNRCRIRRYYISMANYIMGLRQVIIENCKSGKSMELGT